MYFKVTVLALGLSLGLHIGGRCYNEIKCTCPTSKWSPDNKEVLSISHFEYDGKIWISVLLRWTWRLILYEMHMKLSIHSFILTSRELFHNFIWISDVLRMKFLWTLYELNRNYYMTLSCAFLAYFIRNWYEFRMHFIWISYQFYMNFIWTWQEICTGRHVWASW